MIEYLFELDQVRTRKRLRFGIDDPRCERCGNDEIDMLCEVARPGKAFQSILCSNCKVRTATVNAKASTRKVRQFEEAGYFEPVCVVCSEPELQVLECDHVANKVNSDFVVPLCSNHHASKSFGAAVGPMAALRLHDPERHALVFQAACELGMAAILGMMAVWDGANDQAARAIFLGLASSGLFLWAIWNIRADNQLSITYGVGYNDILPAIPVFELPKGWNFE